MYRPDESVVVLRNVEICTVAPAIGWLVVASVTTPLNVPRVNGTPAGGMKPSQMRTTLFSLSSS